VDDQKVQQAGSIDITYVCNLSCYNCNRSVGQRQAPTKDRMTVDQIKKFISESIAMNYTWNMIRILGGEPAVHPDALEIMRLLCEYRAQHAPKCTILFVTNGYGEKVKRCWRSCPRKWSSTTPPRRATFNGSLRSTERRSISSGTGLPITGAVSGHGI
jgi:molybdenum cofactor biosynthesis enzyme MoaA